MSIFDRFRSTKPATTLDEDRPLTREEKEIAEHLLRHAAPPEALAFIPQLRHARVTGRCSCGCPTVDLEVPPEFRVSNPPEGRPLADATGRVNGKLVGVMLFQNEGLLGLLETYRLEDFSDAPFGLPPIITIERLDWTDQREKKNERE